MTKIKIAHTESSCGWGGQEIRILEESQGLKDRGHSIQIVCPRTSRIYHEASRYGIETIALPIKKKRLSALITLYRWIKTNRPDVINTHSSTDSWLVALSCKFIKSPPSIIRTRHISSPIPNNFASRWLYSRSTDHIVTTGNSIKKQITLETGTPSNRITSIPTGVDPSRFQPANKNNTRKNLGLPIDDFLIGIVATLRSWKGHLYLLDAFAKIQDDTCKLIIVGDGPYLNQIKERINSLNINDSVILAGHQNKPEQWLQALDIFCLPSYANEGVPQAIIQAMFTELAIISTPVGAIQDAVENNESALLVPPKDSEKLSHSLLELINSDETRSFLARNARKQALSLFSIDTMLDKMEDIFSASIKNEKKPSHSITNT